MLSWIIVGALAGWVTSLIAGTTRPYGRLENISVGIIGAVLGGVLFSPVTGRQTTVDWNVGSVVAAVIGALVPLVILRMMQRG